MTFDLCMFQATEMDSQFSQIEGQVEERREAGPDLPITVQKNNREDVTDKFQKFDIKTELESEYICTDRQETSRHVLLGGLRVTNPPIRLMFPTSVCLSVNIFVSGL